MAREFDDRHLHAETNTEKRDAILARVADGGNLAFAAAVAEAAGNEDAVSLLEQRLRIFLLDFLRFDAIEFDVEPRWRFRHEPKLRSSFCTIL